LAVLAVVFAHFELSSGLGSGGMVGVDVFFCLSGFLITTLLLEEHQATGRIRFAAFYRRRVARLAPAMLLFVLAVTGCVTLAGTDRSDTVASVPAVLLYIENWWAAAGHSAGALGHMWSLAVEEQFYFVWPAIVVLTLRYRRAALVSVALLGIGWALASREHACLRGMSCVKRVYLSTDTRMDQVLLGALLAVAFQCGALAHLPRAAAVVVGWLSLGVLGAFATSATQWDSRAYDTVGMSVTAVLACAVIASVLIDGDGPLARALSWRPLRMTGLVSYGIYLWNELFLVLLRDGTGMSELPRAMLVVVLTAAMAGLSWTVVERPILRRVGAASGLRSAAGSGRRDSTSIIERVSDRT
jgi:peptidoglycan/LPS O-acetylase OafA/YrhL